VLCFRLFPNFVNKRDKIKNFGKNSLTNNIAQRRRKIKNSGLGEKIQDEGLYLFGVGGVDVVGLEVGEDLWGEGDLDGEGMVGGGWGVFGGGGAGGAVVGAEEEDWGGEEEGEEKVEEGEGDFAQECQGDEGQGEEEEEVEEDEGAFVADGVEAVEGEDVRSDAGIEEGGDFTFEGHLGLLLGGLVG
jgi:hypothetical protein